MERHVGQRINFDRTEPIQQDTIIIQASQRRITLRLKELWEYRELVYFLVWRNLKVRYKQTLLGVGWVALQPLLAMGLFSLIFGRLANIPSDGIPYPVFVFAGLLPWQYFSYALTESGNSLVANQHLITKVYFPRLIIPLAMILSGLIDLGIGLIVLGGIMWVVGIAPTWTLLTMPLFVGMLTVAALAIGLWLSALNVRYRDVRHTLPFFNQLWLFATPVAYSTRLIPEEWRWWYALNPLVSIVEGFRWALLGAPITSVPMLGISSLVIVGLLFTGLRYFRRMEKTFADIV